MYMINYTYIRKDNTFLKSNTTQVKTLAKYFDFTDLLLLLKLKLGDILLWSTGKKKRMKHTIW